MKGLKRRIIRGVVRFRLGRTSKEAASRQIEEMRDAYLDLAAQLNEAEGKVGVRTAPMLGVDEDMRGWSFFQLMEHNAIVNRSMTSLTVSLAEGKDADGGEVKDPKVDVMPSADAGVEQVGAFEESITAHLAAVASFDEMKKSAIYPHPLFGEFTAHHWHAMLGFHLKVHLPQAKAIAAQALASGK